MYSCRPFLRPEIAGPWLLFLTQWAIVILRLDPEKLYTSAADRAELLAMNEFEREEMLADRHEV